LFPADIQTKLKVRPVKPRIRKIQVVREFSLFLSSYRRAEKIGRTGDNPPLIPAFHLQTAVLGKGYDDFGRLRPVGQDLGGFGLRIFFAIQFSRKQVKKR
jgi:hypothetical protein